LEAHFSQKCTKTYAAKKRDLRTVANANKIFEVLNASINSTNANNQTPCFAVRGEKLKRKPIKTTTRRLELTEYFEENILRWAVAEHQII
jgi:hypothetical protein